MPLWNKYTMNYRTYEREKGKEQEKSMMTPKFLL